VLALVCISTIALYAREIIIGVFSNESFVDSLRGLGLVSLLVIVFEALCAIALNALLSPLARTVADIDAGKTMDEADLQAVQASTSKRLNGLIGAMFVLGFVVGPIAIMVIDSATGVRSYSLSMGAVIIVFDLAIGMMAMLGVLFKIESIIAEPLGRLGLFRLSGKARSAYIGRRITLVGLLSTLLAGVALATAGWSTLLAVQSSGTVDISAYVVKASVLLAFVLLAAFFLQLVFARSTKQRLDRISSLVGQISTSSGSSRRIPIVSDDEVAEVTAALNILLDSLESLLVGVKGLSGKVLAGADSLASSASHAGGAVGELEASLASVRSAVERQSEIVGSTKGDIVRMVGSIDTVAARVADQASFVEQSSAAVSEMAANIASVSRTAGQAAELSTRLGASSAEGGEALKAALEAIREIETASHSVTDILGSISKIAAQTNLLAMNAAIEAAHAGSAGAGFAVVADEVRSLAESSSKSTKEIVTLIKGMTQKIERGAALADRAGESFSHISKGVAETGELVQTIAASMGEQSEGTNEILSSVSHLTEATHEIKELTIVQKAESKTMEEAMTRIVSASDEISEAVQAETGSTQALGRVISVVAEEAEKNHAHVTGLEDALAAFGLKNEA
jgi:methyl-accepting chemotaxis protein